MPPLSGVSKTPVARIFPADDRETSPLDWVWGSITPITLATCGFGQAGRQSERRESLGLKPE